VASATFTLQYDLPIVEVAITCSGRTAHVSGVLIDTGSESSCFECDLVKPLGLLPSMDEILQVVRGVGGVETVYSGTLDKLSIGDFCIHYLPVDIGRMGYGFGINAILGMDFLLRSGAVIDLPARMVRFSSILSPT
jgi:hypothetical protein